jgi:hypothetical protein
MNDSASSYMTSVTRCAHSFLLQQPTSSSPLLPLVSDVFKFDRKYFNLCTFRCPERDCCAEVCSRAELCRHSSAVHGTSDDHTVNVTSGKNVATGKNVLFRKVRARCKMCDERMRWEDGVVQSHLKREHEGMSLKKYFDRFKGDVLELYNQQRQFQDGEEREERDSPIL